MATVANVGSGDIRENVINVGGIVNIGTPAAVSGLDRLRLHVAYEAMHDSGEVDAQGHCHLGTRIAIQQIIKRWAENEHPDSVIVSLMLGAAGAGKSAIMRTVAKTLEEEGKLLGGFFCFRSSKRRNDGSLVIPTLVEQMIQRIPSLQYFVDKAIATDHGLFKKTMEIQATKLIIEPLNSIDPAERLRWPYVVLLDGLDEISGVSAQQEIVKIFSFINDHLVYPLHFLIASRPEPPIREAFDKFMGRRYSPLELDESLQPDKDIEVFYVHHFREIRERYPHFNLPLDWPGVPVRRILVEKGSGKFIFASVVVGVVGAPSSTMSPQERLERVLKVTEKDDLRPLERLDLLYVTVLDQIPEADRPQVLRILSLIVASGDVFNGLLPTPRFIDALFCSPPGTTRQRLCHLHSVLKFPEDDSKPISPQHATLGDFVFERSRSERFGFHVDGTKLVEDTVVQIAEGFLSNSESMANVLEAFGEFFGSQLQRLGPGSLMLKLANMLQAFSKGGLSSLHPVALILFAAPVASELNIITRFQVSITLSYRIINETHRRARLYCTDYGAAGVTLLGYAAIRMCPLSESSRRRWGVDEPLGMKTQVTNRGLFNMDRTSGLGLTYAQDHDSLSALLLIKHSWLNLYLPLLARADFVTSIVAMGTGGNLKFGRTLWPEILPFDSSTVSALRTCLSAMPPEDCNDVATIFLSKGVEEYIRRHWKERWHIRSLFLLDRDFKKWTARMSVHGTGVKVR